MDKKNEKNNVANRNKEDAKAQLLKELSENMDLAEENEGKTNKGKGIKAPLGMGLDLGNEISAIMPLKDPREKVNKLGDCTVLNLFGDDDNDNFVSFYGPNGDIQDIVEDLEDSEKQSKLPGGYLSVVRFYKISNEKITNFSKSIDSSDLKSCKMAIEKIVFDGKMVTKINSLNFLLIKSKDVKNESTDDILNNEEYSYDLFAWRDLMPGQDSFYRSIMFAQLEYMILTHDFEQYKTFLYDLICNLSEKKFQKMLEYYSIDIIGIKISLVLLYYTMFTGSNDNYIEKAYNLFMKIYNFDINFDTLLILNLKYMIYKYLKISEKKIFSPENKIKVGEMLPNEFKKNGVYNFRGFYENNLLILTTNVEQIAISVIPFIFKRNLYIYSFESTKINNVFYKAESKENKESIPFRIVNLNGSYDIIYDKEYYVKYIKFFSLYSNIQKDSVNLKLKPRKENVKKEGVLRCTNKEKKNDNINNNNNNKNNKANQNANSKMNNQNNAKNFNQNQNSFGRTNNNIPNTNQLNPMNNQNNMNNPKDPNMYNISNSNKKMNNGGKAYENTPKMNNDIDEIPNVFKDMNEQNNMNNNYYNNNNNQMRNPMTNNMNSQIRNPMPSNMPNNMPNNIPNNMPNNMPNNIPNNIPNNMPSNMPTNIPNNMASNLANNMPINMPINMAGNIPNNIPNNMASNIIPNNIPNNMPMNMPSNMPINMNNNMPNNMNNSNVANTNINNTNNLSHNNMTNSNSKINNNISGNSSQGAININTRANTVIDSNYGNYNNTQYDPSNLSNNNFNNQAYGVNALKTSAIFNQNMNRECLQCKKPSKDNFYCEQCILNHLITYTQTNYIQFIKKNIGCLVNQKETENMNTFLANLNVVFNNGSSKTFSECFYLISDQSKNIFNEQLNSYKKSICLGCFNSIKDKNENFYFRLPCGCIFCNSSCLNVFLNAIPLNKMESFTCGCGAKYDYIQLKYFLHFAISFNLMNLKKEIMRYMYGVIKTKCCKCKKPIEKLTKDNIKMNAMELFDQEAERIFDIHKFNHFICEKCDKSKEMTKNKFYCNLCVSEHSLVKKLDYNNIQTNNSCFIF